MFTVAGMGRAGGQQKKAEAAAVSYTGCVDEAAAAGAVCACFRGALHAADGGFQVAVAGHEVTMKGLLAEPIDLAPLTLEVKSTVAVKEACSKPCTLEPPGTRGLHGKEKPGSEGGPPEQQNLNRYPTRGEGKAPLSRGGR